MRILLTGIAGFVGYHLTKRLLKDGHTVVGIDNINDYYDPHLKKARLKELGIDSNFEEYGQLIFVKGDLSNLETVNSLAKYDIDQVCHLAAQAGIRYSITNPRAYIDANIVGFFNVLELCRNHSIKKLCFASSSSVYGLNQAMPFSPSHNVDHPISLYAASKKSNELMAHTYSHLFDIETTGLRFFTVYGPWGRPDMAYYKFVSKIVAGEAIDVYNHGNMKRDFTYIDDIVEGVIRVLYSPMKKDTMWDPEKLDPAFSSAPYRIHNIGHGSPISLMSFIKCIENNLGIEAKVNFMDMQPGDVVETYADTSSLNQDYGYKPSIDIETGIQNFVDWYREYHQK